MKHDPRNILYDVSLAVQRVGDFLKDKDLAAYLSDAVLRSAVERQLGIISEAIARLAVEAPDLASRISDCRAFSDLRQDLHSGPAKLDESTLFRIAAEEVQKLSNEIFDLVGQHDQGHIGPQQSETVSTPVTEVKVSCFRQILFLPMVFSTLTPESSGEHAQKLASQCTDMLAGSKEWKLKEFLVDGLEAFAEYAYFLPHARSLFFGSGINALERDVEKAFILSQENKSDLEVCFYNSYKKCVSKVSLVAERCQLYIFDNGIIMFVLEVSQRCDTPQTPSVDLSDVIAFIDMFRRTYPPYWCKEENTDKIRPGSFPREVRWVRSSETPRSYVPAESEVLTDVDVDRGDLLPAEFWRELLAPLAFGNARRDDVPDPLKVRQVLDERCPYMVFLATPHIERLSDRDMYRLCFADPPGHGDPVSQRFLDNFRRDNCYDRFWPMSDVAGSTRYLCSGHGFCVLGSSKADGNFFTDVVQIHFRRQYFRLGLLVHFQHACLVQAQNWLAQRLPTLRGKAEPAIVARNVLQNILSFVGPDWLKTASNQLQARELVALWQKQLGILETHREVRDTASDIYELLNAEKSSEIAVKSAEIGDAAVSIGLISVAGVVLALATGFLGINVLVDGFFGWRCPKAWAVPLLALAISFFVGAILAVVVRPTKLTPESSKPFTKLIKWLFALSVAVGLAASGLWFMDGAPGACGLKNDACAPPTAGAPSYGSCGASTPTGTVSQ